MSVGLGFPNERGFKKTCENFRENTDDRYFHG